ncbi:DUF4168 domain-containing protein [Gramella sp. GC03-9]|uniref:DUF4168 domain-containing protein n=1 Tax=Christiangramia oceanisediminis TaxID=2920386 RepID=A0A9X2KZH6_9FLAO|nr:DUF4168 domain-containing protein [Gramella oceanisediminis]MCP9201016.1 DUF4168 domain-containing protein [Gramella oceanisediminis]
MKLTKLFSSLLFVLAIGNLSMNAQNQPMPQQEKIEVSDSELSEFAQVFQQIRMVNQEAQQEMIAVVQEEEFELKRFNEIHQAKMNPQQEIETTEAEDKKYKVVVDELQTIQPKYQEKIETVISDSDLSMERYQQLAMALRSDQSLQQRLQEMMKS